MASDILKRVLLLHPSCIYFEGTLLIYPLDTPNYDVIQVRNICMSLWDISAL